MCLALVHQLRNVFVTGYYFGIKYTICILIDHIEPDIGSAGVNTESVLLSNVWVLCFVVELDGKRLCLYDPCFLLLEKNADMTTTGRRVQRFTVFRQNIDCGHVCVSFLKSCLSGLLAALRGCQRIAGLARCRGSRQGRW